MLDRQSMQDFEMRVLFQMNANDSSSLMDSPEASRLGVHRAILYDEGQGRMEKFRPYGLPSAEWLAQVESHLRGRTDRCGTSQRSGNCYQPGDVVACHAAGYHIHSSPNFTPCEKIEPLALTMLTGLSTNCICSGRTRRSKST